MTLQKVKGNIVHMFDKNLADLVRGIRIHKDDERKFIAQCLEEIKMELSHGTIAVKANGICKLTYLQMLGYDISWSTFNIIEVMSSQKFSYKRIGYLAAGQSFHAHTELLMLTTNMIRKDLISQNQYDSSLALSGLSCFLNINLSRELANDILTLLCTTKPYVRKRAVLMMYKVFLIYSDIQKLAFSRVIEKLEDEDPYVQSAAVNVVCELVNSKPKHYLSLSPVLLNIMSTSTNNWILMKVIKIFAALAPLDQRLGKKMLYILTNLIHSTSATSILYESINTVITIVISSPPQTLLNSNAAIQLCVQKLVIFVEDSDQNLRYLGLTAMSRIMNSYPKIVQAHKCLVIKCLEDKDELLRLRALDLILGMISKKTLPDIVKKIMIHMEMFEGSLYRSELVHKLIHVCLQNNYQYISSFEWYVGVLIDLSKTDLGQHGVLMSSQLLDVAVRVKSIRGFIVNQMALLLASPQRIMPEVLCAAAWICGEYCTLLDDSENTLKHMLSGRIFTLSGPMQAIYIHNILKLTSSIVTDAFVNHDLQKLYSIFKRIKCVLTKLMFSDHFEVQERASSSFQLIKIIETEMETEDYDLISELPTLFLGDINCIAASAQQKVNIPEDLDLDEWLNEPLTKYCEGYDYCMEISRESIVKETFIPKDARDCKDPTHEEMERNRNIRILEQTNNPHYLKSTRTHLIRSIVKHGVPIEKLNMRVSLRVNDNEPHTSSYQNIDNESEPYPTTDKMKKKNKRKKKALKDKKNIKDTAKNKQSHLLNMEIQTTSKDVHLTDINFEGQKQEACEYIEEIDEPFPLLTFNSNESLMTLEKHNIDKKYITQSENNKKKQENSEMHIKGEKTMNVMNEPGGTWEDTLDAFLMPETVWPHEPPPGEPNNISSGGKDVSQIFQYEKKNEVESLGSENGIPKHICDKKKKPYSFLAEDKTLKMLYEQRVVVSETNTVLLLVLFMNKGPFIVNKLEFIVSETPMMKLHRDEYDNDIYAIKVKFNLPPNSYREDQFKFKVVDSSTPQKLRGTLTYMMLTDSGISTHEKLDFWLLFPCSSFMVEKAREVTFEHWSVGQIFRRSFQCVSGDLRQVTAEILSLCPFVQAKHKENVVSLQCTTLDGYHVCLQVLDRYPTEGTITIEGNSNSELLLINLMDEIDTLLKHLSSK